MDCGKWQVVTFAAMGSVEQAECQAIVLHLPQVALHFVRRLAYELSKLRHVRYSSEHNITHGPMTPLACLYIARIYARNLTDGGI